MTRPTKKCIAEELEGLLLRINDGKPTADIRKQANRLISAITPHDSFNQDCRHSGCSSFPPRSS
jgi:hypothetical protein